MNGDKENLLLVGPLSWFSEECFPCFRFVVSVIFSPFFVGAASTEFLCNRGKICCTAKATAATVKPVTRRPLAPLAGFPLGKNLRRSKMLFISTFSDNPRRGDIVSTDFIS